MGGAERSDADCCEALRSRNVAIVRGGGSKVSWIKVEYSLLSKPEVMQMAAHFDISEHEVVGHLVAFWCWVDTNVSPECPDVIGTKSGLDRVCGREGMVEVLIEVGWLSFDGKRFSVPNMDRHLSKSAKQRSVEARKKQNQRSCPDVVPMLSRKCPDVIGTKPGLDKIREDKNSNTETQDAIASTVLVVVKQDAASVNAPKNRSKAFEKPTVQQIIGYVQEIGSTVDAKSFWDYYESNGWRVGRNPMKDWRATVRQWQSRNHQGNGNGGTQRLTTSQHRENANASAFNSIRAAIAASGD
jgi:hypothetical protein